MHNVPTFQIASQLSILVQYPISMPPLLVLLNWTKLKLIQQMHVRVRQYHLSLSIRLFNNEMDAT